VLVVHPEIVINGTAIPSEETKNGCGSRKIKLPYRMQLCQATSQARPLRGPETTVSEGLEQRLVAEEMQVDWDDDTLPKPKKQPYIQNNTEAHYLNYLHRR
jgi:hypothetical protein